ncbi:MAG: hypothetical protein KA149_02395 [Chitinophagales bacterium]|nr:hypothetical protein [Chitinophagales bacterium]
MKAFYYLLLLALLSTGFSSCKKDKSVFSDFELITEMDASCDTIGAIDPFDWTYDKTWSVQEEGFLKFRDSIPSGDSVAGWVEVSPACPNPNNGQVFVGINTQRNCKMRMVCINNEQQIVYYTARKFTGGQILTGYDFRGLTAFHANENYRFYYGFYTASDSLYYKGHGDFRIE